MNLSAPFIRRPVGTILLTIGLMLAGVGAFFMLPVAPLPQFDFPPVMVQASLPGASPSTMASSVAAPSMSRDRSNCSVICADPTFEREVISLTPAIVPR